MRNEKGDGDLFGQNPLGGPKNRVFRKKVPVPFFVPQALGTAVRLAVLGAGAAAAVLAGCSCEGPRPRALVAPDGTPLVRVKLGDDVPSVHVAAAGPYRLVAGSMEIASADRLDWMAVENRGGEIFVGRRGVGPGPIDLVPAEDGTFRIRQLVGGSERDAAYRGWLRLAATADGRLRAVNIVNTEAYVAGVVCKEMSDRWHIEALKAQAVAARTYALAERGRRLAHDFDLFDSPMSQHYGGAEAETAKAWEAVTATRGIVGAYAGDDGRLRLLMTYYHSTCGGATCPAGNVFGGKTPPPLRGVECNYCRRSPRYEWRGVELSKQFVTDALRESGTAALRGLADVTRVEVAAADPNGRATRVCVADAAGRTFDLDANAWRLWLCARMKGHPKIYSTKMRIHDAPDRISVDGHGWGHGVGMCQWGAQYLAEQGLTGEQVLRYYYPGMRLARAY